VAPLGVGKGQLGKSAQKVQGFCRQVPARGEISKRGRNVVEHQELLITRSLVMTFIILHFKIREFTWQNTLSKHSAYIRETFAGHRAWRQPVLNGNGYCQTVTTRSQAAANTCRPRRECSAV
jgi:hypothetical protein